MRVTYIAHSCFLIEWRYSVWLFDHYYGAIPEIDKDKELLIFSSHRHKDHFDPQILSMFADHPRRTYIFSYDIADLVEGSDIGEEERRRIVYLEPRTTWECTDSMGKRITVHTLRSTDIGVAFLIRYGQDAVYHAGDLNWWAWPQDTEEGARDMAGRFQDEIRYLKGYAGAPRGRKNCSDLDTCVRQELKVPRGERYELCRSVHAEANAIISASREQMIGSSLYLAGIEVSTGELIKDSCSCSMCKRLIINAGIETVYIRDTRDAYRKIPVRCWIEEEDPLKGEYGY